MQTFKYRQIVVGVVRFNKLELFDSQTILNGRPLLLKEALTLLINWPSLLSIPVPTIDNPLKLIISENDCFLTEERNEQGVRKINYETTIKEGNPLFQEDCPFEEFLPKLISKAP